uniref:Uncharacterized protein n=1 Tax=viral metagenome TaxID=1070528 RepID=A0A6C0LMJ6_9ZZZZ
MSGKKNTTVKNPAWMLRKATAPPGSGLGFNTSMNKKPKRNLSPMRTTRKMGSPPQSPKRPKKHRVTRRR